MIAWRRLRRGPASLRTRLIVAVGLVVLITVAVAFAAVYHQTNAQLRNQLDSQIRLSAGELAQAMTTATDTDDPPVTVFARARAYVAAQPYQTNDVALFALVPGEGNASNHPELVNPSRPDDHESQAEQTLENREARHLAIPHIGYSVAAGADVGMLRVYEERLTISGGRHVYAGAAEPLAGIRRSLTGVARSFEVAGVLALLLTLAFAYLIGSRASAPLRATAAVAARINIGDLTPRLTPPENASQELFVLADAFNRMLDRLTAAFDSQREFIADASHELRTPLTVMRGQLDLLAMASTEALTSGAEPVSAEELMRVERLIQAEVSRITRLTDDLLLLAQSEQDDFLHPQNVELAPFISDLWDGLSLTAERHFEVGRLPAITLRADPDRLAQALRNLALNAINHTEAPDGLVRITATATSRGSVTITVSDDGPGIPADQREHVFERFFRTDPARSRALGGAGLGLAIVKAIVSAHGGSVRVGASAAGGASIEIELPVDAHGSAESSREPAARESLPLFMPPEGSHLNR